MRGASGKEGGGLIEVARLVELLAENQVCMSGRSMGLGSRCHFELAQEASR